MIFTIITLAMEKLLLCFHSCKMTDEFPYNCTIRENASSSICGVEQEDLPLEFQMEVNAFCYGFSKRPTCSHEIGSVVYIASIFIYF